MLTAVNWSLPIMRQYSMNFFRIFWEVEIVGTGHSKMYGVLTENVWENQLKQKKAFFFVLGTTEFLEWLVMKFIPG